METENTNRPQTPIQNPSQNPPIYSEGQSMWSKKIRVILAIIVALLSFGVGGYLLGTTKNQTTLQPQQVTVSPTNTPQTSPSNKTIQIEDPTANWKTYINEKLKFSIKYPTSWTEKSPVADNNSTLVYLYSNESFGEGPEPIKYYVWIYSDNKLPNAKLTKEVVGEYTVYKTDELPSRSGALSVFITKDEKTFISASITPYDVKQPFPSQDKYVNIFNQMLSTFRLTVWAYKQETEQDSNS